MQGGSEGEAVGARVGMEARMGEAVSGREGGSE